MVSLQTLLLALAISNPGETVLLEFTAPWCGPCKAMEPTIQRLKTQGYPVRQVNIDQQPQLAARFQARSIPCLVMLSQGREVDRVVGATSYDRLLRMFKKAEHAGHPATNRAAPQTPTLRTPAPNLTLASAPAAPRSTQPVSAPTTAKLSPQQRAFQATVRLKIDDPQGFSYGTGTIIDLQGEEALVITCAHVFRDSKGKGKINVDLFPSGGKRTVAGQLISYDMKKDVALVSFRPGCAISSVHVASGDVPIRKGDAVFTIGCDRGADPTMKRSRITGVNKYLGPANFEVAGQPVDGRSGGGLFSQSGHLIGVCNAADPADNEGIYAALPVVHWQLDRIGLKRAYQPSAATLAGNVPVTPKATQANHEREAKLDTPPLRPIGHAILTKPGSLDELIRLLRQDPNAEEVICIVRSAGQDRVVVLDPQRLKNMPTGQAHQRGPVRPENLRSLPNHAPPPRDPAGRVIRAQSQN